MQSLTLGRCSNANPWERRKVKKMRIAKKRKTRRNKKLLLLQKLNQCKKLQRKKRRRKKGQSRKEKAIQALRASPHHFHFLRKTAASRTLETLRRMQISSSVLSQTL